eukprot:gene30522-58896_t
MPSKRRQELQGMLNKHGQGAPPSPARSREKKALQAILAGWGLEQHVQVVGKQQGDEAYDAQERRQRQKQQGQIREM